MEEVEHSPAVEEQSTAPGEVSAPADGEQVSAAEEEVEQPEALTEEQQESLFVAEATEPASAPEASGALRAVIEAAIYITDEPLSAEQIASAIEQPLDRVKEVLTQLVSEYSAPDRGLSVREIAGGYKMATKPEHHEAIRRFVKNLQPPFKLSLAALETLAVIAYKQPITTPEIMEVRGVQGAGVLKTLLDRKLIATAGRKNVLGKPMMYKTTREFLLQFGLASLAELPTLKEFEEIGRMAMSDGEEPVPPPTEAAQGSQTAKAESEAAPEAIPDKPGEENA